MIPDELAKFKEWTAQPKEGKSRGAFGVELEI
jgi:hypothetical protein